MALTKPRAYQIYDIDYKQATRVITVANITLSGGAPSQVDGVNLSLNDRVLVTGQTNKAQNGIYDVDTVGSGSNGTWVRSGDTNTTGELLAGTIVMVTEGLIYADTQWKLTTNDPITIGVSELIFEQNSAFAFGNVNANGTAVLANSVGSTISLSAGNNISITGNNTSKTVTIGVTGISLNSISNGTSNVNVVSSGGNVTVGIAGTSNVAVFSSAGANITGTLGVSGNITGGNLSGTSIVGTLTTASQTNITSVGTLGSLTVTANVAGGNLTTAGQITATGNITGGNLKTSGVIISSTDVSATTVTATANVAGGNLTTAGQVTATGNVSGGNLNVTGNIVDTGALTLITGASGNVTLAPNGSTVLVATTTGANITGTLNATGNANVGNLGTAGQVVATGNVTGGNLTTAGQLSATGNATVGNLTTTIANFTTFNSSIGGNVTGTLIATSANAQFFNQTNGAGYVTVAGYLTAVGNVTAGNIISNAAVTATGNITGGNILGNGVGLSGINTFKTVAVTGGNSAVATNIADTLTLEAGSGIVLVANSVSKTITFSTGGTGESIFATGGDMELITDVVTDSLDLGLVTEAVTENNDLGGFFIEGFVSNDNFLPGTIYGNILLDNAVISTTGNITAGYFIGNGSQLTGVTASLAGNLDGNIEGNGFGANSLSFVSTTGNVTAGNLTTTGAVYSNFNTNTANTASFNATGGNTKGGTGYLDFLVARNTSGGATNPYKWLRVNSTGGLEVINSAYTSTLMTLTDAGAMSISGSYQVAGKQAVNGPVFRAYIAVGQAITSGSQQKVTFGTETFDTNSNFASSRFTPTVEGYYQFNATVRISGGSSTGECMIILYKNGAEYSRGNNESGTEQGASFYSMQVSDIAYANGTGDYFEIYIQQTSGSNKDTTAGAQISYFSGVMVRGA
jgi:hypothetical protein